MFSNPKFTPLFGRFPQLRLIGDTRLVRIPLAPDLGSATVEIKAEMTMACDTGRGISAPGCGTPDGKRVASLNNFAVGPSLG